jgi:hypothetical protein
VIGSVAQGPVDEATLPGPPVAFGRAVIVATGILVAAAALVVYGALQPDRLYDHFVWQALAFLDGRAMIDYPVGPTADSRGNAFFQDVLPIRDATGATIGALIPFPPLPAIVLLPFVAIWGAAVDDQAVAAAIGALDVLVAFWALGGLAIGSRVRLATTVFLAFGTVLWYAAFIGTTWFQAHLVAVGLLLLAVGLAIRADPAGAGDEDAAEPGAPAAELDAHVGLDAHGGLERRRVGLIDGILGVLRDPIGSIEPRQLAIGFLFGLAATARLTVVFGAPFFMLVGAGGTWARRSWSAGLGAIVPVGLLLAYNVVSTGHLFHPAYEYQYQLEANGYPELGYEPDWSIEDPRYVPRNLELFLFGGPAILPDVYPAGLGDGEPLCTDADATRSLLDRGCPIAMPRDVGMSVLLTSPAFLLAFPLLRRWGRSRLITGAGLAIAWIAFVNLMHFSQGWVQFGYRFSNDFVPFALPLVALGLAAASRSRVGLVVAGVLLSASVLVNAWGVAWGAILGW